MLLTCNAECTKIKKKSSSPAFKDLEIGDVINFSVPIEPVGSNRGRTYAVYIRCFNTKTREVGELSFNQIGRILKCFEFEELDRPLFAFEME